MSKTFLLRPQTLSQVSLKIYNILGQEIMTVLDDQKQVGTYEYDIDASQLASGMYIYSLRAGDFTQQRKMLLLK